LKKDKAKQEKELKICEEKLKRRKKLRKAKVNVVIAK
jgi:hypothetical protein